MSSTSRRSIPSSHLIQCAESIDPDKRHLVVSGLMSTFKKIWVTHGGSQEYILTNTLLGLLERRFYIAGRE